ncbi:uncharacterized protein LOC106644263 [Copidosoma floridanum]|uniref:uncharacterized protein LOC106644263 n=1 Tax=Copidosoma floridanum TaxID=29053 RepID=UPI0006C94D9F|nr:uncharacterized protein LOC106644263 [Copidosoma floridanum]
MCLMTKLDEDWTSYDRVIGSAGETVNPWSIINIQTQTGEIPGFETKESTEADKHWMAIYSLCSAQLARTNIVQYAERVRDKIHEQIKLCINQLAVFPARNSFEPWAADPSYIKMVAAIDLFMYRFPNHEHANVRVCTLGSRHKDCAGLLSIGYLAHTVSFEHESEFLDWVWSKKMARECISMMRERNEMMQEFFYFPYQSDLGLIRKSYYSAKDDEPKEPKGMAWFSYARAHDFELTPQMRAFVADAKAKIGKVREGSISEYVKTSF